MAESENGANIYKTSGYDETYWADYLRARPSYSGELYDQIYAYHAAHGGRFDAAADVGTGPGNVAEELASRFSHIYASDTNAPHLEVAARRLEALTAANRLTISNSALERVAETVPPASIDLATAAECFSLVDVPAAMHALHTILRPGGTVAIWFYGRPIFAEPQYAAICQPILDGIFARSFGKAIRDSPPAGRQSFKRAADLVQGFLDSVELQPDKWTDVHRYKWNSSKPMLFFGPDAVDFDIEPTSAIGPDEQVSKIEDPTFWQAQWDMVDARRFVRGILPHLESAEDDAIQASYKELEQAMGGPGVKRNITWPAVLILATRI